MKEYIKECIESFGGMFNGGASAPAKKDLFELDDTVRRLSEQ